MIKGGERAWKIILYMFMSMQYARNIKVYYKRVYCIYTYGAQLQMSCNKNDVDYALSS